MLNKWMGSHSEIVSLRTDSGETLRVQLRRSQRAMKTRIVVTADKIEVVAPMKAPVGSINAFVTAQQEWIKNAMRRVQARSQPIKGLAPSKYDEGVNVPYQGQAIPLVIQSSNRKKILVQLTTDARFIAHTPFYDTENRSEQIRQALEKYMRHQARQTALQLIDKHGKKHELIPRALRIKTMKSRWGSCGPHDDINLNWLLMLAPPVIFEYVVIHELCHIKHKNHSKEFWQMVANLMPDYLQHRQWLKQHGNRLMQGL